MGTPNKSNKIANGSPGVAHAPDDAGATEEDILQQLQDGQVALAAAQRLTGLRQWSYDAASKSLQCASDAPAISDRARARPRSLSLSLFLERVHPQDRHAVESLAWEVLHGNTNIFTFQFGLLREDGKPSVLKGAGEALVGPGAEVRRVVGCVTEQSEPEIGPEASDKAEPHIPGFEASSSSVWLWDQDSELRFTSFTRTQDEEINEEHESFIGKRRWELSGATPCSGTWDDHKERLRQRRAFHDFEYRLKLHSGKEQVFSTSGVPRYTAKGRFIGYHGTTSNITALKDAQDSASRSKALLQLASRLSKVGAWAVEMPDMKVSWSSELLALYELEPRQQVTPELLDSFVASGYRDTVVDAMRACYAHGSPVDIEFQARTAKGRPLWLRLRAEAVFDGAGKAVRVQAAVQDISDRKRDAERLEALNRQLTTTFESITDGFVTVDRQLRFTYVNAEAERRLGVSPAELLGKKVAEHFPAFAETAFRREFERALAEGTAGDVEAYSPTGQRWLNIAVFPSEQGLALYIRDVTRSRKAQQELVLSEERYRLLFETSADAILKVHPNGQILRANQAACAMFGRTEAQMQQLPSRQLAWPGDKRLEPMVRQRLQHGGARGELTMLRADGSTFEAEVNTSTFRADGQAFVNIVIRDATERIQLRRKLIAVNEELADKVRQRTQELERANGELSGFARSLAHDLRQPVIAAKSLGLALQVSIAKGETNRAQQYAGQVNESIQWIGNYVEAMLSLTKVSRAVLALQEVDLSALAIGLLEELQRQYPSRHVAANVQPGLLTKGDPTLLRLLLQNLLGNAWKFTGRTQTARISFSAQRSPEEEMVYSVRDNGAGFDVDRADRLFETFQRFHKSSEFAGTGIGLANAHKIVQKHGGRIWAESEPGRGATFFFTLGAPAQGPATTPSGDLGVNAA